GAYRLQPLRLGADPLAGYALFCVALATATFLSNGGLAIAWALEGLVLATVAARANDRRPAAAPPVFLAPALLHRLARPPPVPPLLSEHPSPARHVGVLAVVAVAVALAAVLAHVRRWPSDRVLGALAALLALYAVSLLLLAGVESL